MLHPRLAIKKVFVIPRDDINAGGCSQITQGIDIPHPIGNRAVNEIARNCDQINAESVRGAHDFYRPPSVVKAADVQVGQL